MGKGPTILITCGEISGDQHAAKLVTELLKTNPDANIIALGGSRVAAAGADVRFHIDDFAIIGFSGVVTKFPKLARLEISLKRILENGVDLFIPVDYPGLNLRLAAHAKKVGVPVLYYISPQVWAWGRHRIRRLARSVDFMAVILPFEEGIYRDEGIPVEFVGHPLAEESTLPEPRDQGARSGIGLLPGSRPGEVRRILPVLLASAERIKGQRPDETFSIGLSPSVPRRIYEKIVRRHDVDATLNESAADVMAKSRLLLIASGTATLEGALFETPLIIVYRVSMLNYFIASRLVKIDDIGLVNIILGERICPEFVQEEAKPEDIARHALSILNDNAVRSSMVSRFSELRGLLTGSGASRRVAEISRELMLNST
ncbi:MAG: lipid-A-disaccharide synthase [bacterium]|nr:lipid-A-disaccharide synthase [bacterium]